jgi:glucose-6-phosphate isomerase
MFISYFDDKRVVEKNITSAEKKLKSYREQIATAIAENNDTVSEYSLFHAKDFALHETLTAIKKQYKGVKHVVLVGIGGSSLGVEAVHQVLDRGEVKLTVLDTVSAHGIDLTLKELLAYKKVENYVICIVSKSGKTTETLANASVLLDALVAEKGEAVFKQTIVIGDAGTELMQYAKKRGLTMIAMPQVIGGRYSVATAVGLVPLTLLGYDVDDFIAGYLDASEERFETLVAESAARIAAYHKLKYHHYNFFAFEPRLAALGGWYRQLFAESLGKEIDVNGKSVSFAMVPTISTAVELHSVGQLYMSGVPDTYTDFVTFDDEFIDMKISRTSKIATALKGYSLQEVTAALYGGVMAAYQERQLPYRATIFEESLPYSLGLFMAMRLREVMYIAKLLEVNAFDQPNVELYKIKTKEILSL